MNTIKITTLSLVVVSSIAFAGGDMAPVQPHIETPEVTVEENSALTGLYAGIAYSCQQLTQDTPNDTAMGSGVSANLGYNFNKFLAVEARYTTTIGDMTYEKWNVEEDKEWEMSNVGIYLKPQANMGAFGVYGLIGYGQTTFDNGTSYSADGIQYGAGLNVNAAENVQLFVDYRRLYDDSEFDTLVIDRDIAANSWTAGLNYQF